MSFHCVGIFYFHLMSEWGRWLLKSIEKYVETFILVHFILPMYVEEFLKSLYIYKVNVIHLHWLFASKEHVQNQFINRHESGLQLLSGKNSRCYKCSTKTLIKVYYDFRASGKTLFKNYINCFTMINVRVDSTCNLHLIFLFSTRWGNNFVHKCCIWDISFSVVLLVVNSTVWQTWRYFGVSYSVD